MEENIFTVHDQDMFVLIILASACLALCITLFAVSRRKTSHKSPPGPCGLPFFGTSLSIDTKHIHLEFDNWNGEYGDIFVTKLMGKNVCVISNPNLIRKAFESEEFSPLMSDRSPNFMGTYVVYGYKDVLLRPYDDTFIQMKKIMVDAINHCGFNSPHYVENANIEFKDVVTQFRNTNSEPVDPLDILMPSFCNLIAMFYSGSRYTMKDPQLQVVSDFDRYGDQMITPKIHATYRLFPWVRGCPGFYGRLFDHVIQRRADLMEMFVKDMKSSYNKNDIRCFVHALFKAQEEAYDENGCHWFTDEHVNGMIMDLINTSVLTTKAVMSGTIFLLLHFPKIQENIWNEIQKVIGTEREPTFEDMGSMPYTHAFIFEVLRYQSHLPLTAPHANLKQEVVFEGYTIPKGCVIFGNLYTSHHDPRFYDQPWEFLPERFLTSEGQVVGPDHPVRQNLIAFGVGKRACVGYNMAINRMFLYTTHLLQSFKLLVPDGTVLQSNHPRDLEFKSPVTMPPAFKCKMVPRNADEKS